MYVRSVRVPYVWKNYRGECMKINCLKSLLIEGLNTVAKAVSSRATTPILECVLLSATDEGLKLMANDLELVIETSFIDGEILENGAVALDAKVFNDIVRAMPGTHIEINVDSKNLTIIKSGKIEYKILGMSAEEFPEFPMIDKVGVFSIASVELKNMIRQTIFSVSTDPSKPVLCGQFIHTYIYFSSSSSRCCGIVKNHLGL